MTLQKRAHFDTWQQRHFGGSIWDPRGVLRLGLTESQGRTILEAWERAVFQCVDEIVVAYHRTECEIMGDAPTPEPS